MKVTTIAAQAGFIGATILLIVGGFALGRWDALIMCVAYVALFVVGFVQVEKDEDDG